MKRTFKILLLSLTLSLFMVACGDDEKNENKTPNQNTPQGSKTGKFIDAPVKGLRYVVNSAEGYTDEYGNFKYDDGDQVEFFIGKISLGKVTAGKMINPMKLAGDTGDTVSTKAANIARLLQTLGTGEGNIMLPENLKDLYLENFDLENEDSLTALLGEAQKLTSKTYTMVTATDATSAMNAAMDLYDNLDDYVLYDQESNTFTLKGSATLIITNMILEYEGSYDIAGMTTTIAGKINYAEGTFTVTTNGETVDNSDSVDLETVFPMVVEGGSELDFKPMIEKDENTQGLGLEFTYTFTFETSYGNFSITEKM